MPEPHIPVDLRADGVLWMINRCVFHPRGFALAIDDAGALTLMGNGSEPWQYGDKELEDEKLKAFNLLLLHARVGAKGAIVMETLQVIEQPTDESRYA